MLRNYKIFIISLFLVQAFSWVSRVEFQYGIPQVVKYLLSITVLVILIYTWFRFPSKPLPGGLFYPVLMIFILYSIILLVSSLLNFNSLFYLQSLLGQKYFFIPYLLPIIILFTRFDLSFFRDYFHYSFLLLLPAIVMQFSVLMYGVSQTNWSEQAGRILVFDIGSSFLLMTAHFSRKKYVSYIIIFYFIIWIFLWSAFGRRGMLVELILFFTFMIFIRLRSALVALIERIKMYLAGMLLVFLFIIFGQIINSSYAFQRGFNKAGFEESRGLVFEDFFADFQSNSDWVFGRGLEGKVLRSINPEEGTSSVIENGFLTVLLKGGLVYLIPFIIILLRASYLGLFRSNNDLVKGLAALLLIHVLIMFYFNLPEYSARYILIWISVSTCFNPRLRNYSNREVSLAINFSDSIKCTLPLWRK